MVQTLGTKKYFMTVFIPKTKLRWAWGALFGKARQKPAKHALGGQYKLPNVSWDNIRLQRYVLWQFLVGKNCQGYFFMWDAFLHDSKMQVYFTFVHNTTWPTKLLLSTTCYMPSVKHNLFQLDIPQTNCKHNYNHSLCRYSSHHQLVSLQVA